MSCNYYCVINPELSDLEIKPKGRVCYHDNISCLNACIYNLFYPIFPSLNLQHGRSWLVSNQALHMAPTIQIYPATNTNTDNAFKPD